MSGDPWMLLVVTGGRTWNHSRMLKLYLRGLQAEYGPRLIVYVGDCETGADQHCRDGCEQLGIDYKTFYVERDADGQWVEDAGPARNRRMCDAAVEHDAGHKMVLACHDNLDFSKRKGGTLGCVREARQRDLPVYKLAKVFGQP